MMLHLGLIRYLWPAQSSMSIQSMADSFLFPYRPKCIRSKVTTAVKIRTPHAQCSRPVHFGGSTLAKLALTNGASVSSWPAQPLNGTHHQLLPP